MDIAQIITLVTKYAGPVLMAIIILVIGRWIAGKISRGFETSLNRAPNSDASLSRFFASLVRYLILFVVAIAALTVMGIDTSSMSAAVLGLGAAMAFILQGSLSNLAAGVMLLLFRPYDIGDDVTIDGVKGTVTAIELTATRLKTADNVEVIIANGIAWGGVIKNHTSLQSRRLDINFGIDYNSDINSAIDVITKTAAQNPRVHSEPAPWAKVVNLGDSSVDIQLRAWCDAADYKALGTEISQPIKQALDTAGIGIPYPHEVKIKQHVKHSKARDRIARLKALREQNS
jgi:small conductance mechanosensitive channel